MNYVNKFTIGESTYVAAPFQSREQGICIYSNLFSYSSDSDNASILDISSNIILDSSVTLLNSGVHDAELSFSDNVIIGPNVSLTTSVSYYSNIPSEESMDVRGNLVIGTNSETLRFDPFTQNNVIIGSSGFVTTASCDFICGGAVSYDVPSTSTIFIGGGVKKLATQNGTVFQGGGSGHHCFWSRIVTLASSGGHTGLCTVGVPYSSEDPFYGFYSIPTTFIFIEYMYADGSNHLPGYGYNMIAICPNSTYIRYSNNDSWYSYDYDVLGASKLGDIWVDNSWMEIYQGGFHYNYSERSAQLNIGHRWRIGDPDHSYRISSPIPLYLEQEGEHSHTYTIKVEQIVVD